MKLCIGCKKIKSTDQFSKHKSRNDGLQEKCKLCVKEYKVKYYQANKDYVLLKNREWRLNNREKRTDYFKKYRKTVNGKGAILRAIKKYELKNKKRRYNWDKA